jgi:hypothetical protein
MILNVSEGCVCARDDNNNVESEFVHPLSLISRFTIPNGNYNNFLYVLRDLNQPLLYCHLYHAYDPEEVSR